MPLKILVVKNTSSETLPPHPKVRRASTETTCSISAIRELKMISASSQSGKNFTLLSS
jgi:hypothetical protein